MDNTFISMTRHQRALLVCLCFLLCVFSHAARAIVTYNGTGGVNQNVFSTATCVNSCHSHTTLSPASTANANRVNISTRVGSGDMPRSGVSISTDQKSLVSSWSASGLASAAPTVTPDTAPPTDITQTQAILKATVNDNGAEASYTFNWEVDDGNSADDWTNFTAAVDNDANSGGGLTPDSATATITGLSCGMQYQYQATGRNSAGTTIGNIKTFSTASCPDDDGDGIEDPVPGDNCPQNFNPDQLDTDEDGEGNACDTDDDNDGIPDLVEQNNNLDPLDNSDGTGDLDNDGISNLDEFNNCNSTVPPDITACDAIGIESIPPEIQVQDLVVVSTGYMTAASLRDSVTATDRTTIGGPEVAIDDDNLVPTVVPDVDLSGPFRPGRYDITWTATDDAGNPTDEPQTLDVLPLVTLGGTQITGEDRNIKAPVTMNGNAPTYPVSIGYSVTGTADASDYDPLAGTVDIESGTEVEIDIHILSDAIIEPDEQIVITLTSVSDNAKLSDTVSHTVVITERNMEPSVSISVSQADDKGARVYVEYGDVTVTANALDPNDDPLTYDWTSSDPALPVPTDSQSQFTIFGDIVEALSPGRYPIVVLVSDGLHEVKQSTTLIVADPPFLSTEDSDGDGIIDDIEGFFDEDEDGIPDYLDPVDDPTLLNRQVQSDGDNNFTRLITTTPGLRLAIGQAASKAQAPPQSGVMKGAALFATDVKDSNGNVARDPGFNIVSDVYDYEIHGLTAAQRTAKIVIPLRSAIPKNAKFRKFANGVWTDFVETATDGIRSARSDATTNECPPPGDPGYEDGLIPFNDCLKLTLTDGGPNDADGEVNGVIRDPGTIVVPASTPTTSSDATSSPGGAGALNWWWLLMLTPLLWLQYRSRQGQTND